MKVALTDARGTRIEDVPDPECGPGDVVCRVLACATCGSDVGWYVRHKLPAVLGHEPVGEVVEVGAGVAGLRAGDRVAIHHHAPCGECRRCRHGHETLCEQFRATALDPGGFAEYVRIMPELVGELLPLDGTPCRNPAFDVTPAELVWALVTEHGAARPVTADTVARVA